MDTRSFAERCRAKLGIKGVTREEWKAQFESRKVLEHPLYDAMSAAGENEGTFGPLAFKVSRQTNVGIYRVLEILGEEERRIAETDPCDDCTSVEPGNECPACDENREDWLVWHTHWVVCSTCGYCYHPATENQTHPCDGCLACVKDPDIDCP
jgi:hypothetical protein